MGCLKLEVLPRKLGPLKVVQTTSFERKNQKVDWYTYNNPIRYIDPDGNMAVDALGPGPGPLSDDPFAFARILTTLYQDFEIATFNATTAFLTPSSNPVRPIKFKSGDDGYTKVEMGLAVESPGERLRNSLFDVLGSTAAFSGNPVGLVAKSGSGTSLAQSAKALNKNSNDAVGNFGIYQINIGDDLHKIGKADLDRVTQSTGLPTRLHQQVRSLSKTNSGVQGNVIQELGSVTTKQAKNIENFILQKIFDQTGKIPPGNQNSFKPN